MTDGANRLRFSERHGFQPVRDALQVEGMDSRLSNALWSVFYAVFWQNYKLTSTELATGATSALVRGVWQRFYGHPSDTMPLTVGGVAGNVRAWWFADYLEWWRRYDLLDFVVSEPAILPDDSLGKVTALFNEALEAERSAYRFVGRSLVPLTSAEQVAAVEQALADTSALSGASHHLTRALDLLADRQSPDFANSIKESVSAVEAVCRSVVGDDRATLGDALKALERRGVPTHPALREAFLRIYGYTSDADGIRHAASEAPSVGLAEATYFLVSCSAFVSYLLAAASSAGIAMNVTT